VLYIHIPSGQTLHIGDLLLEHPDLDADDLMLPSDYAEVRVTPKPFTEADEDADATIAKHDGEYVRKLTQEELDAISALVAQADAKAQEMMERAQASVEETSDVVAENAEIVDDEIVPEPLDIITTAGPLIIEDTNTTP
jgi:hypothetical protein